MSPAKPATQPAAPVESSRALAVRNEAALALYADDAGTGFENTRADDFKMPFFLLLQKSSDYVDKHHSSFVDGAEPGLFFNNATLDVIGESMDFVVCHYHRAMVEWIDYDAGGGFIAQHPIGYEETGNNGKAFEKDDRGHWRTMRDGKDTSYLADTRYFFGLRIKPDGTPSMGVVSLSSTALKRARTWLTQLEDLKFPMNHPTKAGKTLPLFASLWRCTSVPEQNDRGSWSAWRINFVKLIDDPNLAAAAKKAATMFAGTAADIVPPQGDAPDGGSTGGGSAGGDAGKDVPF